MLMICSPSGFGRDAYSSDCAVLSLGPLCWPFSAQNIHRKRNSGTRTDLKIEFSMAVPRAGEAVADCSEAEAGGRSEVLSTGKRPAIVRPEKEVEAVRAIYWSLVTFEQAVKFRLQLAMARSLLRSRTCCGLPVASSLVVWVELSGWRGFSYLALLVVVALSKSFRWPASYMLDNSRVTKEQ